YQRLLSGSLLDEMRETLEVAAFDHRLNFGGRPVCTSLRPFLVTAEVYRQSMKSAELVLRAIERIALALPADEVLREYLRLTPLEEELVTMPTGYSGPEASGRLDGALGADGEIRFLEYNADSPGGLLYGHVLSELFGQTRLMKEFARRYPVEVVDVRGRLSTTLLESYREWLGGGRAALPRIAIVDWEGVATREEFEICRRHFETLGIPAIITTPDELQYRGGWLQVDDFRVTLVYKRVVISELIERYGAEGLRQHPLFRATRDRAACLINGFRAQVMTNKTMLAILSDPAFAYLFRDEELPALRRHIPWTRLWHEGLTSYHQRRIDLPEFALANRERLVLKPTGGYGGRGVTLGWECADSDWAAALEEALDGRFIIQERVDLPRQPFPFLREGELIFENRYADFAPYTWRGDLAEGAGVRLSESSLLNVCAGGGSAAPLFIIRH
ncbi:MAG: hypothetical protein ACKOB4_14960, partial [Acidobacteriota bacterium]